NHVNSPYIKFTYRKLDSYRALIFEKNRLLVARKAANQQSAGARERAPCPTTVLPSRPSLELIGDDRDVLRLEPDVVAVPVVKRDRDGHLLHVDGRVVRQAQRSSLLLVDGAVVPGPG